MLIEKMYMSWSLWGWWWVWCGEDCSWWWWWWSWYLEVCTGVISWPFNDSTSSNKFCEPFPMTTTATSFCGLLLFVCRNFDFSVDYNKKIYTNKLTSSTQQRSHSHMTKLSLILAGVVTAGLLLLRSTLEASREGRMVAGLVGGVLYLLVLNVCR